jgi:hypothetical protein
MWMWSEYKTNMGTSIKPVMGRKRFIGQKMPDVEKYNIITIATIVVKCFSPDFDDWLSIVA